MLPWGDLKDEELLGISRGALAMKLERYGLPRPRVKEKRPKRR
jgi:hypothetical protein